MPVCSRPNWNSEVMVFKERRKPEKNLSKKGRELTTNSTHIRIDARIRTRATLFLVGGECSHHRTALAPQDCLSTVSGNPTRKYFLGTDKISHTTPSLSPLNTGEISPNHSGEKLPLFANTGCSKHFSNFLFFRVPRCKAAFEKGT